MAYDIHITRASCWSESNSQPIGLKEIEKIFGSPVKGVSGKHPQTGETIEVSDILGFQLPGDNGSKIGTVFYYSNGRLFFKHRVDEEIELAKYIACILGATVQGDEGEIYEIDDSIRSIVRPKKIHNSLSNFLLASGLVSFIILLTIFLS